MKSFIKFEKLVNVIDKIIKIAMIAFLVGYGVVILATVVSYVVPAVEPSSLIQIPGLSKENKKGEYVLDVNAYDYGFVSVAVENIIIDLESVRIKQSDLQLFLLSISISMLFNTALVVLALYFIRCILAKVKEKKPFSDECIVNLRRLSYCVIIGSFLTKLTENVIRYMEIKLFHIQDVIEQSPAVLGVNLDMDLFNLDFMVLGAGLLILLLAGIFQYGKKLQDEVDATV